MNGSGSKATVADVIIIGGGPAGSSVAIALARRGVKVVVCEAGIYPRAKVCGEFLSPECTGWLSQLGLPGLLTSCSAPFIQSVQFTAPDGATWKSKLPGTAWGVSRWVLDEALAQAARRQGVDVREGLTIIEVTGDLTQGFDVKARTHAGKVQTLRSRLVVGAYGKRSALDRAWQPAVFSDSNVFIGLKAHFSGPQLYHQVQLFPFRGGYAGLAEIEDGLTNLAVLVDAKVFRGAVGQEADSLMAFSNWVCQQNPYFNQWFNQARRLDKHFYSISRIGFGSKHVIVNDVLMIGDAAGLAAPLVGDGIGMALQSGLLIAEPCIAYLQGRISAIQLRHQCAAQWHQQFRGRLVLGRALQAGLMRPRLCSLALRMLTALPHLGQQLILQTRTTNAPWPEAHP